MEPRPVAISNRHPRLKLDRVTLIRAIRLLDAHQTALAAKKSVGFPGELSVVFLTDAALAQLHDHFLDDPTTTDVITFEGEPAHGAGGEICVSVDTAARYAAGHGRDFRDELLLYVVHGWLHLAGHDDLVPARKRVMRRAEQRAINLLRQHDAVPALTLRRDRKKPSSRGKISRPSGRHK
ncbi:MAG: rRNA maturation RNase YbeY [Opitutaceae bacterium]|nr:rRNA maturation RNase YbeY [Opitutaceae bacterium]